MNAHSAICAALGPFILRRHFSELGGREGNLRGSRRSFIVDSGFERSLLVDGELLVDWTAATQEGGAVLN